MSENTTSKAHSFSNYIRYKKYSNSGSNNFSAINLLLTFTSTEIIS